MRQPVYSLLPTLLLLAAPAVAQVSPSIDRTDMPVAGDTLRLSTAAPVLPAGTPPLTRRGANQTWNYGSLVATGQNVQRYVAINTLGPFYQFAFGPLAGANRATVAAPQDFPVPAGLPTPITDPYAFFATSAAGTSPQVYKSVGYGATVGGLQLPVTYASATQQDIIYRFPLSFASQADSSSSYFTVTAPSAGSLSRKRKRVNRVDAWGTLTTPFGTFQTVRVVSTLRDRDSIAIGAAPGVANDVPLTREYKWLAKQQHVPLLTITTQELGGTELVRSVEYRDIYRRIIRLSTRDAALEAGLTPYPNPSAVGTSLTLTVPAGSGPLTITATDLLGRQLFTQQVQPVGGQLVLDAALFGQHRGVLLLRVASARGTAMQRVARQ